MNGYKIQPLGIINLQGGLLALVLTTRGNSFAFTRFGDE
jgi:hypothetical protein